jgi:hypothetical protein
MITDVFRAASRSVGHQRRVPSQYRPPTPATVRPANRWPRRTGWLIGAVTVLGAAWVVITGLLLRSELSALPAQAHRLAAQVQARDFPAATSTARSMQQHSARAHRLGTGPAWAVATRLPFLGPPLRTLVGLAAVTDDLNSNAVVPIVAAAGPRIAALRGPDGRIDLAGIAALRPMVASARTSILRSEVNAARLPSRTVSATANHAVTQLRNGLQRADRAVVEAERALAVLPPMLGIDGPRTYFVAFQNNAEARGTGGLPGAFAVVELNHGLLRFRQFEADTYLAGVTADVDLGHDYDVLYGNDATKTLYVNSNLSPNFPDAARIWASMWQKKSGRRVDGAVALDPEALSYLLAVTGPARSSDGTSISADNVAEMTESSAYLRFGPDIAARKQFLIDVARTVASKVTSYHGDSVPLIRALVRAAGERRLLVWSRDPVLERTIEPWAVSGAIPVTSAPYAGLSVVNEGGEKLDYYLDRSLSWSSSGCGPTRDVLVTIGLTNSAPAGLNSPQIVARSDHRQYSIRPGDNRVTVYYYATAGALLRSATLDGRKAFFGSAIGQGHPVFSVDVELPRGSPRTVTLHLIEPRTAAQPIVLQQPLARPLRTSVVDVPCAGRQQ